MTLDELVVELKEYLRIDVNDTEDDSYLENFAQAAAGYIASVYRYHIIDETLVSTQQIDPARPNKFYLPRGPVKGGSVTVVDEEGNVVTNPYRLVNSVIYYKEPLPADGQIYTITYDVGVGNGIEHKGDIEHAVALAAWLYRTADKGLEGIDQISTGVKESAKMFSGIPKNITSYFETRQVIRL